MADDVFDFTPGAQVPLTGAPGQTGATNALASAAYRDGVDLETILGANNDRHKSTVKPGRIALFKPNLGEAFARAVQVRMLGGGRAPLIQSFGIEPQVVVEHCLAASRIRRQRDGWLTVVMVVCGVIFLPGLLAWLLLFQGRRIVDKSTVKRASALSSLLLWVFGILLVLMMVELPVTGFWPWYARLSAVAPVVGWYWARQICERTAQDLRSRWGGLLAGNHAGPKIPEAVPTHPNETAAEQLRQGLARLSAEQEANTVFYAGPKGILGMGTRWGSWQLAEDLVPRDPDRDFDPFRSWDVIRAIHDQLKLLDRTPLHTGGFPPPSIKHWIVSPIDENAGAVSRPGGTDVEAFQIKPHEIQRICNEQQFGSGDRHYLGVQFVLWDGQLVLTMLITVTVLHRTLRIEVTGYALGPIHPLFKSGPVPRMKTVSKPVRFWETKTTTLPMVTPDEVVRLAVRAPLTYYPPVLEHLGGSLQLPEPFGLRHAWADQPWRHRFMADDALRTATPVLRVVHEAALKVLEENGVDTDKFGSRSGALSGQVQDVSPGRSDMYNA